MDTVWVWQVALCATFFVNFGVECRIGTNNGYRSGFGWFYHVFIFRWLWSGPVYLMPLLAQPRLPTETGTWWAGVVGSPADVVAEATWAAGGWLDVIGWTMFAFAWTLWIWAFIPRHPWAMRPPETICRAGPYRFLRHPINAGWLLFCTGYYLLWGGVVSLWFVPVWYAFFILEAFWEERWLLEVGDNSAEYRRYRDEVPMFIPTLAPVKA